MAQSEYKDVRDGDWLNLRHAIRRMNERLSQLEGYSGTSHKYSETNMKGNQILSGPNPQVKAQEGEFITKNYLRSAQSSEILLKSVKAGGQAPLVPSIQTSGSVYPTETIVGGGAGSLFTNFDTELWIPVYNPYFGQNLDLSSGVRVYSTETVPIGYDDFAYTGVLSNFRIYYSTSGRIRYRIKISNFSFDDLLDGRLWSGAYLRDATYSQGICVNSASSTTQTRIGSISENIDPAIHTFTGGVGAADRGASPVQCEFDTTIKYQGSTSVVRQQRVKPINFRLLPGGAWGDVAGSADTSAMLGVNLSISIFLGVLARDKCAFDSTISEFELIEGTALLGVQ